MKGMVASELAVFALPGRDENASPTLIIPAMAVAVRTCGVNIWLSVLGLYIYRAHRHDACPTWA